MSNRFECEISKVENGADCVMTVRGDIDLASAPDFESSLRSALDGSPSAITIDLAGLTFIDSLRKGIDHAPTQFYQSWSGPRGVD